MHHYIIVLVEKGCQRGAWFRLIGISNIVINSLPINVAKVKYITIYHTSMAFLRYVCLLCNSETQKSSR